MHQDEPGFEHRLRFLLADAWRLPEPIVLERTSTGTNNATYRVDSPSGAFIAQISLNATDSDEHMMRNRVLTAVDVPFSLPIPLPTTTGARALPLTPDDGRFLTIFSLIPGTQPDAENLLHVAACGRALAQLHTAFATLDPVVVAALPKRYGDILDSPTVEAKIRLLRSIHLPPEIRADAEMVIASLADTVVTVWPALPTHAIHGDFWASNVLMQGEAVTGVLDFEFLGVAPRAMDLACGLRSFALTRSSPTAQRQGAAHFLNAYDAASTRPLLSSERSVLTELVLVREVTSLFHWIGRWQRRLTTARNVAERVNSLLELRDRLRWTSVI
jgi:homoserine kinase type II